MNNCPYKMFLLEGEFHTDGDFHLDLDNDELKMQHFDQYFFHEEGSETYSFSMQSNDIYKVNWFLENLIVICRVGSGHYYLVKELYEMIYKIKSIVFEDDIDEQSSYIFGNYDGTFITLTKFK